MNTDLLSPPRGGGLKLLAMIAMMIDHIGYIFEGMLPFALAGVLRMIGRLAFPIFAYHCAVGAIHTHSRRDYLLRMGVCAILSQIPYAMMTQGINVLITLMAGVVSIWLYQYAFAKISYAALGIPLCLAALCQLLDTDYGGYGVMMIFLWYLFPHSTKLQGWSQSVLTVAVICTPVLEIGRVQCMCLLALPLIFSYARGQWQHNIHLPSRLFYVFYPLHIMLLLGIRHIL